MYGGETSLCTHLALQLEEMHVSEVKRESESGELEKRRVEDGEKLPVYWDEGTEQEGCRAGGSLVEGGQDDRAVWLRR